MGEREYTIAYSNDTRKRHYHKTEKGTIVSFIVQLEIKVDNEWKPVIRYDCAHEYAHCDKYNLSGKQRKINLELSYSGALTFGDKDIKKNWKTYRERFLKGFYP